MVLHGKAATARPSPSPAATSCLLRKTPVEGQGPIGLGLESQTSQPPFVGKGSSLSSRDDRPGKGSAASHGGPDDYNVNLVGPAASHGGPCSQAGLVPDYDLSSEEEGSFEPSESDSDTTTSSSTKRKRRAQYNHPPAIKKRKAAASDDSGEDPMGFDPQSLVKAKEGSFKAPKAMKKYLNKHLRRCLSKEEREALLKEHPRPDLESAVPPKADKFIIDFLGKKFPKEHDTQLSKIQASVLASIRPLTSSWQTLVEEGLEEDSSMVVKASEVLSLVQRTLCLVGNASELISQTRRSKILEAIEPSWVKYGSDAFPSASGTLFGEEFQESLTKNVEKDGAISKALYVTRKGKKTAPSVPGSSAKQRQQNSQFFRGGPAARYGGRQGKSFLPYSQLHSHPREGEHSRWRQPQSFHKQNQKPLYHEPKLPPFQKKPP